MDWLQWGHITLPSASATLFREDILVQTHEQIIASCKTLCKQSNWQSTLRLLYVYVTCPTTFTMGHGTVHSRVIRLPWVFPYTACITGYVSTRIYTCFSPCILVELVHSGLSWQLPHHFALRQLLLVFPLVQTCFSGPSSMQSVDSHRVQYSQFYLYVWCKCNIASCNIQDQRS